MRPYDQHAMTERPLTAYVANVVDCDVVDEPLPVGSRPLRLGEQPDTLLVLYGEPGVGATVAVAAADDLDAERIIAAVLGDVCIDDLAESHDQRPLAIAHLAGLVDDRVAERLLELDARSTAPLGEVITTQLIDATRAEA